MMDNKQLIDTSILFAEMIEIITPKQTAKDLMKAKPIIHNLCDALVAANQDNESLTAQLKECQAERDKAVDCIEEIQYQSTKMNDEFICSIINKWRGLGKDGKNDG